MFKQDLGAHASGAGIGDFAIRNDVLGIGPLSRYGNGHVLACIYRIGAPSTMHMHQGVFATEKIIEW